MNNGPAQPAIRARGLLHRWFAPAAAADQVTAGPQSLPAAITTSATGHEPALIAAQADAAAAGLTRDRPAAFGAAVDAGLATLQVLEVVAGADATAAVLATHPLNTEPRDGVTYVLVRLAVENGGEQPLAVSNDDFGLTGASGLVRRFVGVEPPKPAFELDIAPGESAEGWVVLSAQIDDSNWLLWYDSVSLAGNWTNRFLALEEGAAVAEAPAGPARDDMATSPEAAVSTGVAVTTDAWQLTLQESITGAAVFDLVDYRTGALGDNDPEEVARWLGLRFQVTATGAGAGPFMFPSNAFALVQPDGAPLLDIMTLTPPVPDAAGDVFRGGSREGWVVFELPIEPVGDTGPLVRFDPFADMTAAPDPRYFNLTGVSPEAPTSATSAPTDTGGGFAVGAVVEVTETEVRIREAPSTSSAIVGGLTFGAQLTITGAPETGDGYTWYPINDSASGQSGYVPQDFIALTAE